MPAKDGRINNGKPKGARNRINGAIRDALNQKMPIMERADLMISLAKGIYYKDPEKGVVYVTPPNLKALELIEGYASGKPSQMVQVDPEANTVNFKLKITSE